MRRPLLLLVSLAVLGGLCAGCGIPVANAPKTLPKDAEPPALLQKANPGPHNPYHDAAQIVIYLIQDISGELVPVTRTVERPVTVQEVIDELEQGPDYVDYRNGDESAVSTSSDLVAKGAVKSGVSTIRLDQAYEKLTGEAPVDELGQIVWSLVKSGLEVRQVRFLAPYWPYAPTSVEIDTGGFVDRPVGVADYKKLVSPANQ